MDTVSLFIFFVPLFPTIVACERPAASCKSDMPPNPGALEKRQLLSGATSPPESPRKMFFPGPTSAEEERSWTPGGTAIHIVGFPVSLVFLRSATQLRAQITFGAVRDAKLQRWVYSCKLVVVGISRTLFSAFLFQCGGDNLSPFLYNTLRSVGFSSLAVSDLQLSFPGNRPISSSWGRIAFLPALESSP
jgi:hypothetical protein